MKRGYSTILHHLARKLPIFKRESGSVKQKVQDLRFVVSRVDASPGFEFCF